MKTESTIDPNIENPEAHLEQALIDAYLRMKGVDAGRLRALPAAEVDRLLGEASFYAATKLAEVGARAHFVHEIHGEE